MKWLSRRDRITSNNSASSDLKRGYYQGAPKCFWGGANLAIPSGEPGAHSAYNADASGSWAGLKTFRREARGEDLADLKDDDPGAWSLAKSVSHSR